MAKSKKAAPGKASRPRNEAAHVSTPIDDLMLAAAASGGDSLETGRFIVTLKEDAGEQGLKSFKFRAP